MFSHLGEGLGECGDPAALEHRHEAQEGVGGGLGVAQGGVAEFFGNGDAEAMRQRVETMHLMLTVNHGGEEHGVEHRMVKGEAQFRFAAFEERHVEGRIMRYEHGPFGEAVKAAQGVCNRRGVLHHRVRDTVHVGRGQSL